MCGGSDVGVGSGRECEMAGLELGSGGNCIGLGSKVLVGGTKFKAVANIDCEGMVIVGLGLGVEDVGTDVGHS